MLIFVPIDVVVDADVDVDVVVSVLGADLGTNSLVIPGFHLVGPLPRLVPSSTAVEVGCVDASTTVGTPPSTPPPPDAKTKLSGGDFGINSVNPPLLPPPPPWLLLRVAGEPGSVGVKYLRPGFHSFALVESRPTEAVRLSIIRLYFWVVLVVCHTQRYFGGGLMR